jgi:AAA+ superfamily predicted ATPase
MNRNWVAREKLQSVLISLGLPAVMDSSHVVVKDVDSIALWLLVGSDVGMSALFGINAEALSVFQAMAGPVAVTHIMSPGISFLYDCPRLDGVAMRVRLAEANANEGPEVFVVPVEKQMLNSGAEWTTHVALVPRSSLGRWLSIIKAVDRAEAITNASRMVLQCYNGETESIAPMKMSDIVLDPSLKFAIESDVRGFLSVRGAYTSRRLSWTRKYLFNGPPGTGKTSIARWMATELKMPAVSFDFTDRYADGRTFKAFIRWAKGRSPAVVILDDFEKVLGGENRTGVTSHTILTSLSGMGNLDGLIFAVTSNSTKQFDGPMRRRFDVIYEIPLPGQGERLQYLTMMLSNDGVDDVFIRKLVSTTDGWSFDDLRGIIASAIGSSISQGSINEKTLTDGFAVMRSRRNETESQ